MIQLPERCLRDRNDCEPWAQMASDDGVTFVCCGLNDGTRRTVAEDRFRVCWRSAHGVDEEGDRSERDVKDTISVLAQALSANANMREDT